jgi:hypothetical protein
MVCKSITKNPSRINKFLVVTWLALPTEGERKVDTSAIINGEKEHGHLSLHEEYNSRMPPEIRYNFL